MRLAAVTPGVAVALIVAATSVVAVTFVIGRRTRLGLEIPPQKEAWPPPTRRVRNIYLGLLAAGLLAVALAGLAFALGHEELGRRGVYVYLGLLAARFGMQIARVLRVRRRRRSGSARGSRQE